MVENSSSKELIAANSMYRIAQTIILRDKSNTEPFSKKQLFALLNGMIADILSACFTNLPRVITMKCHESMIEKREASVKGAARLLGKTTKIIERLEKLELPSMDPDKMVIHGAMTTKDTKELKIYRRVEILKIEMLLGMATGPAWGGASIPILKLDYQSFSKPHPDPHWDLIGAPGRWIAMIP
ncbi:hypothetical protein Tco_0731107 [Tanacetum coccineum]